MSLTIRKYGDSGRPVVLLHGGPGAAGYMAPVAQALADVFRVFEPFQRGSGGRRLSVAVHVEDLEETILEHCPGEPPALVGHSWGAMLALAYAAAHPERTGSLVLIGCGSFDPAARARMRRTVEERTPTDVKRKLFRLVDEYPDADERLCVTGRLLDPIYSFDLIGEVDSAQCDARAFEESWRDMVRLQDEGVYPAAFRTITAPTIMLHGQDDPHPGRMIHESLQPFVRRLEYVEWDRCGHYPWLEREVYREFYRVLRRWLKRH